MALPTKILTIAEALTDSEIQAPIELGAMVSVLIMAPAVLAETVTVMVAESATGVFVALQDGGTDVTLTAAKATQLTIGAAFWKLTAGAAVAAGGRAFRVIVNRIGEPNYA